MYPDLLPKITQADTEGSDVNPRDANEQNGINTRYALSFTTGGLLTREAAVMVPIFLNTQSWQHTKQQVIDNNLLQTRTITALTRITREAIQRLSTLSNTELELFDEASPTERNHVMWAATCRRYDFIADFAEEVLRERFLTFNTTLSHEAFDRFVTSKTLWHPELDDLAESTRVKLRSNLFRMLQEAGFVTEQAEIAPALLSERVTQMLQERNPSEVRLFPTTTATTAATTPPSEVAK